MQVIRVADSSKYSPADETGDENSPADETGDDLTFIWSTEKMSLLLTPPFMTLMAARSLEPDLERVSQPSQLVAWHCTAHASASAKHDAHAASHAAHAASHAARSTTRAGFARVSAVLFRGVHSQ